MFTHPFPPLCDENSKILILGSFPSVMSRKEGFYYGHPRNRFWKVLAAVFDSEVPQNIPEKKAFLSKIGVALWDIVYSCEIRASDDTSIRNVVPNDVNGLIDKYGIRSVCANGQTSGKLSRKYVNTPVLILPSTSPANASYSLERLIDAWSAIKSL